MIIEVKIPVEVDIDEIIKANNLTTHTSYEDVIQAAIDYSVKTSEDLCDEKDAKMYSRANGIICDRLTGIVSRMLIEQLGV